MVTGASGKTEEKKGKTEEALSKGGSSEATRTSSEETQPVTYTEEQYKDLQSKLDRQAYTQKMEKELAEKRAKDAEDALTRMQKEKDEVEEAAAQGDPSALKEYRAKKAARDKEAELAKERAELTRDKADHKDALDKLAKREKEDRAAEFAKEHGIEAADALELMDESPEKRTEALKKILAQAKPQQGRPDSGVTAGTGVAWRELSADDKLRKALEKPK